MPSPRSSQSSRPASPTVRRAPQHGRRPSFTDPDVTRHLLESEGERVIDEVHKHWITYIWPTILTVVGVLILFAMPLSGELWWAPLVVGLGVAVTGLWKAHQLHMDRFVITSMRVFRVHGILQRHVATMPLARILDISVYQPFFGTIFDYGHFVFESAAQDQGLRDIRFVGDPNRRDLTIQRVIQQAGIRASVKRPDDDDEGDDGT